MRMGLFGLALTGLLATGCVTSGTFEAMKKDRDEKAARVQTLEAALAAEQQNVAALTAERDRLAGDLEKRQGELANMLKDQSQLQASLAEMESALKQVEERKRAAEARVNEFKQLLARFKPLMDSGKLRVKISDGRMVVEVGTDILFASGSAQLSPEGKAAIAEVAAVLAGIEGKRFQVEGHTDNVPIKTAKYPTNWELAADRALTVTKTMIEAGLTPDRVSGASFGEFKPAAPNDTPENKARNRRIEIVVVPDLSSLPGFEDLQKLGSG